VKNDIIFTLNANKKESGEERTLTVFLLT